MHGTAGHGLLDQQPEVTGKDLPADIGVGYQPVGLGQVMEGAGDDLAERIGVRRVRSHDLMLPATAPG